MTTEPLLPPGWRLTARMPGRDALPSKLAFWAFGDEQYGRLYLLDADDPRLPQGLPVFPDDFRPGQLPHQERRPMLKTMMHPTKGTFDACREIVEIDWRPDQDSVDANPQTAELELGEERTDRGVIVLHLTGSASEPAAVQLDRVFDDDEPESATIPYHAISEIRTQASVPITRADAESIAECPMVVWTRAGGVHEGSAAHEVIATQHKRILELEEREANPLMIINGLATMVVFSSGSDADEISTGPWSQGVVLEGFSILDAATRGVIAEMNLKRTSPDRWYSLATGRFYKRCFVQPYLREEEG